MQIFRTVVWVVLLIALLLFSVNNWTTVNVKIWENLILETKLPALVVVSFLLGLVPMWLAYLAGRWRYTRRISALENSVRATEPPPPAETEAEALPARDTKPDPAASDPVYPTSP